MLYEICKSINNFFPQPGAMVSGSFEIENGSMNLPFMKEGQFFCVKGSAFNDGVYKYPAVFAVDESFNGSVLPMCIPPRFMELVNDIEAWQAKHGESCASPYQSESFNGYSYTKANVNGKPVDNWQTAFNARLRAWRRL